MPPRRAFQQSIQLFGTTWELGDGSKDRAKSTANLNGHKCVVQLNCPDSGWRRFGSYATWDACRAATQVLRGTRRHLFEVICQDKPCKPYLDIDSETLPAPYQDVHQLVDHLQAGERGFAEWDHPGAQRVAQVGSTLHPATGLERQQDGLAGGAVEAGATGDVADAELDGRMRGEVRDHIDHTVGRS